MQPSRHWYWSRFIDIYIHQNINNSPPVPILSYSNPIYTTPPEIHSDPILPSTPWFSEWSLSFGLPHQNFVHFSPLSHACHMPWGWVLLRNKFLHSPVTSFLLGTPSNKIFRLNRLKFDLTIPLSMPCEKVNLVFPALSYFCASRVIFIITITY
jgi:hypothetical protein